MDWEKELGDIVKGLPGPDPSGVGEIPMTPAQAQQQAKRIRELFPWATVGLSCHGWVGEENRPGVLLTIMTARGKNYKSFAQGDGVFLGVMYQVWTQAQVEKVIEALMGLEVQAPEKPQDGREKGHEG